MRIRGGRWVALVGAGALALGMLAGVSSPASARTAPAFAPGLAAAATPFNEAKFAAVGTGSELHLAALTSGKTTLAGLEQAFAAQSVNSTGLVNNHTTGKSALYDTETGALIQPSAVTTVTKAAYGRGSGIELGLGIDNTSTTNPNQFVFPSGSGGAKQIEASSPASPSSSSNTLLSLPDSLNSIATAHALEATAATNFSSSFCPLGNPIAYGEGKLADAGVLPTSGKNPLIDTSGNDTAGVAQSKTFSYLSSNGDGTFGLTSETRQTILPLSLNLPKLNEQLPQVSITIRGSSPTSPVILRAKAPGEGVAKLELLNNQDVTIDITQNGKSVFNQVVNLSDLLKKLNVPNPIKLPGNLGTISIGQSYNLPGHSSATTGGTFAGGGFDLVHVKLTSGLLDLALGHMEVMADNEAPITCNIPITKTANPPVVTAGNQFTWNISIPSSADALKDSACDLIDLSATDTISVLKGNPKFQFVSASNGGVYNPSTQTITWASLGKYHIGNPPIMLTITINVPADSPDGVLLDKVDATGKPGTGPGDCKGNVTGIEGLGLGTGTSVPTLHGHFELPAPQIMAIKQLPRTGGGGPILPWVGGGLLVLAEATRRLIRRARRAPATS